MKQIIPVLILCVVIWRLAVAGSNLSVVLVLAAGSGLISWMVMREEKR